MCFSTFILNSLGLYNLRKWSFQILFHLESHSVVIPLLCMRGFHILLAVLVLPSLPKFPALVHKQLHCFLLTSQCFLSQLNVANLINSFIHRNTFFPPPVLSSTFFCSIIALYLTTSSFPLTLPFIY